mmetsp:Transcript_647/g.2495  ORF Transcript_647/g.2495 Transcript_647/m.2495 type:complete len:332 (+) Transcript_647:795-1790(+)
MKCMSSPFFRSRYSTASFFRSSATVFEALFVSPSEEGSAWSSPVVSATAVCSSHSKSVSGEVGICVNSSSQRTRTAKLAIASESFSGMICLLKYTSMSTNVAATRPPQPNRSSSLGCPDCLPIALRSEKASATANAFSKSTTTSPVSLLNVCEYHCAACRRVLKSSTESFGLCPPRKPMYRQKLSKLVFVAYDIVSSSPAAISCLATITTLVVFSLDVFEAFPSSFPSPAFPSSFPSSKTPSPAPVVHSVFGVSCVWFSMSTNGTNKVCVVPPSASSAIARLRTHASAHAHSFATSASSPPPGMPPVPAILLAALLSFPSVKEAWNTASPT